MQAHIDARLAGSLQGDVPAAWLRAQGRQRCQVCGLGVSIRHGIHPTCRPQARAAAGQDGAMPRDGPADALPSIAEIQAGRTPTLRHVPAAARSLWCKVLTKALAAVVHYNDPGAAPPAAVCAQRFSQGGAGSMLRRPPPTPWIGCAVGKMGTASFLPRLEWLCLPAPKPRSTVFERGMSAMLGLPPRCWSSWTSIAPSTQCPVKRC